MKNKAIKLTLFALAMALTPMVMGQSLEEINSVSADGTFQLSLAGVLYAFAIVLVLIAAGMMVIAVHMKRYLKGELGEEYAKRQPFWERLFQIKPIASDKDTVINHPHDGIYELDNPPPPWFMFLFYGTILFAVVYFVRFSITDYGYTQVEEYEAEMQQAEEVKAKFLASSGAAVDESNVELLTSDADLNKGKSIFEANCAQCHGDYGQGVRGPNFTDKNWIYGGDIKDVFKTVKYGTPKGMPTWAQSMGATSLQAVASYVISLEGTQLPDGVIGLPPAGELYDRSAGGSDATTEADTTTTTVTETTETDTTANE